MNTVLPLAALALAVLATALSKGKDAEPPPEQGRAVVFLVLAAALFLLGTAVAPRTQYLPLASGLTLGTIAALAAAYARASGLGGFALGVAATLTSAFVPDARFACLAALGLGALMLASEGVAFAACGAVAALAGDLLGPRAGSMPALAHAGSLLALGTVVAGLVAVGLKDSKIGRLTPVVLALLASAVGVLLTMSYFRLQEHAVIVVASALATLVVHWMLATNEDSLRKGVAAIVWLGLATVAFGLGRGLGMAVSLIVAMGIATALRDRTALLSMAPLFGLVLYRIFRDVLPTPPPAVEGTEYQALVGLIVGAVFPLLPTEWLAQEPEKGKRQLGTALWGLLVVAVPVAAFILTGSRGAAGLAIGLGLGGLTTALRGDRSLLPLGVGIGAAGGLLTAYPWVRGLTTLPRDERIVLLGGIAAALTVVGVALAAMTPRVEVSKEAA